MRCHLVLNVQCIAADSEGGEGGDATSRSGRGGNGGLALLHETVTTTATSASSQILSDLQTGSIHNEVSFVIEDTDETVVINMGGNPGSTGIHAMNVGGVPQAINTGSPIGSADASGGDSGDATSSGGDGGIGNRGDITGHLGNPVE